LGANAVFSIAFIFDFHLVRKYNGYMSIRAIIPDQISEINQTAREFKLQNKQPNAARLIAILDNAAQGLENEGVTDADIDKYVTDTRSAKSRRYSGE
jgi:hypothetical protein